MSIPFIPENKTTFSGEANIRLAIAGLAICRFPKPEEDHSTIKFLRHVEKHQLKMEIIQKLDTGEVIGNLSYTVGKKLKTIIIEGAEAVDGFEHKPTNYSEYDLKTMLDLQFLHRHPLDLKSGDYVDALTVMRIKDCLFYTSKVTDNEFDLVRGDIPIPIKRKFGEILGGYMKVADDKELKIIIPGLTTSPIKLPAKIGDVKYKYEVNFNNSCFEDNGVPCKKNTEQNTSIPTDFVKIYDILEDKHPPYDRFDLKPIVTTATNIISDASIIAINTGACLPVIEDPCLNC